MLTIKNFIIFILNKLGWELRRKIIPTLPIEATLRDKEIYSAVEQYTMTTHERIWALMNAVRYILKNDISGDFVECGVWRGGSAMVIALVLRDSGNERRSIWLYDTFSGMTEPTQHDVEISTGDRAKDLLRLEAKDASDRNIWCISPMEEVERNLASTGYSLGNVNMIKGDVLETLTNHVPDKIALLRLDTDWYESTKRELEVLYPRLVSGGVCILDDYGYWGGAKKAVDEYLSENGISVYMHRIDDTGRLFVKP